MLKYLIYAITQKNGSNLHNLCVNQKPVLYVLHHSGFNSCTKFQNFPIPIIGVLLKKLSQIEPIFTISENKDGRRSAILDPISKSLNSEQWGTKVITHIKFHENISKDYREKLVRIQICPFSATKMAASRPSWIRFQNL